MNELGPAIRAWVRSGGKSEFEQRLDQGRSHRDGALGAAFVGIQTASTQEERHFLANEFWGHIQRRLERMAGKAWSGAELDDDLQSAVTSVLMGQEDLVFLTEAEFLGYLAKRMNWKRGARWRRATPLALDPEAPLLEPRPGPATHAQLDLDAQSMLSKANALSAQERHVLFARLNGTPLAEQAEHLGISVSSCRRLYSKVVEKLGGGSTAP